jgi:hypothetical protein
MVSSLLNALELRLPPLLAGVQVGVRRSTVTSW